MVWKMAALASAVTAVCVLLLYVSSPAKAKKGPLVTDVVSASTAR